MPQIKKTENKIWSKYKKFKSRSHVRRPQIKHILKKAIVRIKNNKTDIFQNFKKPKLSLQITPKSKLKNIIIGYVRRLQMKNIRKHNKFRIKTY